MIIFDKQITKALTRLRGCTVWSAPLLFANPEDRFSRLEAQLYPIILTYELSKGILHSTVIKVLECLNSDCILKPDNITIQ